MSRIPTRHWGRSRQPIARDRVRFSLRVVGFGQSEASPLGWTNLPTCPSRFVSFVPEEISSFFTGITRLCSPFCRGSFNPYRCLFLGICFV